MGAVNDPTSRLLARRIRDHRTRESLTLATLAERASQTGSGVTLTGSQLSKVETNNRAVSVPELDAIAIALGTTAEYLMRAGELCPSCGQETTT